MMVSAAAAYSQDTRSQESRRAKIQKEIAIINQQLKENAAQRNSALSSLTLIRKNIDNRNELVAESDLEIAKIGDQIAQRENAIGALQQRLDTLNQYYNKLVRSAYKNRDAKVWYMYILASDNLGQAFRRMGYLRNLSSAMNDQAKKISALRKELEAEKEKLMISKAEAEKLRRERQNEVNELKKEEAEADKLVAQLQKDRKQYESSLAKKKKQVEALNQEIQRIIRQAQKEAQKEAQKQQKSSGQKNSGSKTTGDKSTAKPTTVDQKLNAEFANNKGRLPWPASGPVVEKFGQNNHPVYKNVKLPFSNGISIAVSKGTQVKAVFDGTVKQVVVMPGYSKCVLVQHGEYFSFYCKLGSVNVKVGDKVKTGTIVGTVDTIDGETQVHFQIWKGTTPQNPALWLR